MAWLAIVACAIAVRLFLFDDDDDSFPLVVTYMLGTWLPLMVANVVEENEFFSYLREHHATRWEKLSHVSAFGFNSFRLAAWLWSEDADGDRELARLKRERRLFIWFMLTVVLSTIIVVPILAS